MDSKKLFEKYYSRLAREGMLKAFICGLIVGFAVDFVFALVTWFLKGFSLWFVLALVAGLVIGAVVAVILYYKVFRPTTKKIAQRIDSLGLEERLITMTELENDDSYIAMRQREDAKAKMNEVNSKNIKFKVAKSLIIVAAVVGVLGLAMTTVNALTAFGIIQRPNLDPDYDPYEDFVFITYIAEGGCGEIIGETEQIVPRGGDSEPVYVEPLDDWIFQSWDDGVTTQERFETNVQDDMIITATFISLDGGDGDNPGNSSQSDVDPDEENKNSKPREDDEDADGAENPPPSDNTDPMPNPNTSTSEDNNKYKDNNTPYGDDFFDLYPGLLEALNDENLTPEERAGLQSYIESLKAGVDKNKVKD